MNNDLISREALKKHKLTLQQANGVEIEDIDVVPLACIDNAPTVEAFTKEDMAGAYNEGYACGSRENTRPQGDLISREALRNVILNDRKLDGANANWEVNRILVHIDNAPTVEYTFEEAFQKTVCEQRLYCPARPQGEWKETGYETGALGITYRQTQCSNCGWEYALPMWWNFCPNCGAEMRKGGAE